MERAKTFFGNRDHEGYVGKEDHLVSFAGHTIKLQYAIVWTDENSRDENNEYYD